VAKRLTTEDALAQVSAIRNAPEKYDLKRDLAPLLQHKSNHVIAAVAVALRRLEETALTAELATCFMALLPKAKERDQGCKALTAIAETLVNTGEHAPEVYLGGVQHIQMEGSYGPPIDVASPLRGLCARGLVRTRHPEALYRTVELLADREVAARAGAVQALGDDGGLAAELLLRLKVLNGDEEDVIAECFQSLLVAAPERSVAFVARYLSSDSEDRAEAAALALGGSRLASVVPVLIEAWRSQVRRPIRRAVLLAIAMCRQQEGVDFLVTRLEEEPDQTAVDVMEALALYRNDDKVVARIKPIAIRRKLAFDWGG
jgi:HEAT repeat protein